MPFADNVLPFPMIDVPFSTWLLPSSLSQSLQLLLIRGKTRQWTAGDFDWEKLRQVRHRRPRAGTRRWLLAWAHQAGSWEPRRHREEQHNGRSGVQLQQVNRRRGELVGPAVRLRFNHALRPEHVFEGNLPGHDIPNWNSLSKAAWNWAAIATQRGRHRPGEPALQMCQFVSFEVHGGSERRISYTVKWSIFICKTSTCKIFNYTTQFVFSFESQKVKMKVCAAYVGSKQAWSSYEEN